MTLHAADILPDSETITQEAPRLLRRLNEPGACLAVAEDMKNAVIVRENKAGDTVRTAVAERTIAEAMALKDWIALDGNGRVKKYRITPAGRVALKELLASQETRRSGHSRDRAHIGEVGEPGIRRRGRYGSADSPLVTLARRLDKNGKPFLGADLVAAGERLREDFELALIASEKKLNWESFLSGQAPSAAPSGHTPPKGAKAAQSRVEAALTDLGPGLGDVILRCCCYLEGMEAVEKRMGWSARSGKIVFRIALTRLKRHYDERGGVWSPFIG